MWNVINAEEIKPHTLEIMNYVKPRPDYLIIGTGEKNISLEFSFYEHFRRMGITVDSCPSVRTQKIRENILLSSIFQIIDVFKIYI
jgi:uncharacterized protein